MAGYSKVIVVGNLTRDVELRYTPDGTPVANFDVAINEPAGKDSQGNRKESVIFLRCTVWRKQAENCGAYLSKGKKVLVEGRLREEKWQGQDGQEHRRMGIHVDTVQFLSPKDSSAPSQGGDEEVPF